MEKGKKIAFLDILLIRYKGLINTTVYGKKTNTGNLFLQTIGNGEHLKP